MIPSDDEKDIERLQEAADANTNTATTEDFLSKDESILNAEEGENSDIDGEEITMATEENENDYD